MKLKLLYCLGTLFGTIINPTVGTAVGVDSDSDDDSDDNDRSRGRKWRTPHNSNSNSNIHRGGGRDAGAQHVIEMNWDQVRYDSNCTILSLPPTAPYSLSLSLSLSNCTILSLSQTALHCLYLTAPHTLSLTASCLQPYSLTS